MTKQYNLHSVRIEDEVWARVKASGISVNKLLTRGLEAASGAWIAPFTAPKPGLGIHLDGQAASRGIRPKGDTKR